ncbi:MAG: Ig-like domain-containing protein, partial [Bacteroidales bacterium]|nr:Ig-like domain-containing protein [Bacteroidales bacterium]
MKIKGSHIVIAVLLLFSGYGLLNCARQGSPAGGPKDEVPPEAVSEMPPNRSVYFNSKDVVITFNEFIQLKDPAKEIFISPPMRTKPEFKGIGKKVVIEFSEELKENSTYTFNFGNAIVDYTEANPLVNYEYVFSTGGHLDSLYVPGKVLNAFNLQPEPDIIVMVYLDDNDTIPLDSLPYKVQPKSASKTTKDGNFRINNLPEGEYKLFALQDFNNNYLFDLPNERIAFLDSLVTLSSGEEIVVKADTADTVNDTIPYLPPVDETDTVNRTAPSMQLVSEDTYTLYLFEEVDSTQKLLGKKLIGRSLLQYIFRRPADSVRIKPVEFQPERPDWYILEFSKMKDTVNFWLREGLPDTIRVCVSASDSLADTSRYILSRTAPEKPGK